MIPRLVWMLSSAAWLAGCQCANLDITEVDTDSSSSTSDESLGSSSAASDESTGAPFDASRWIGRYHFENALLPFGERGDPHGSYSLVNFEIRPDGRASMFYDNCGFDQPILIHYEWSPPEDGWMSLFPGEGETSLRYWSFDDLETLRVRLVEPCRELRFEYDGKLDTSFTSFVRPGESCWVDRCTAPGIMQVDYCEGEEPPPCP